jgi:hypothetical protein
VTGGEFVVAVKFFAKLDLKAKWFARWYKLFDSRQPVGTMAPTQVLVTPLGEAGEVQFWPPRRAPRRPRVPEAVGPGCSDDLGQGSGDEAEAEEHEHEPLADALADDGDSGGDLADVCEALADELLRLCEGPGQEVVEDEMLPLPPLAGDEREVLVSGGGVPPPAEPEPPAVPSAAAGAFVEALVAQPRRHAAPAPGLRVGVESVCYFAFGTISAYRSGDLVATCGYPGHARCRITRTVQLQGSRTKSAKGRPLGLMAAWLLDDAHQSQAAHCQAAKAKAYSFEQRRAARTALRNTPGSEPLFEKERGRHDTEQHSEPEGCP